MFALSFSGQIQSISEFCKMFINILNISFYVFYILNLTVNKGIILLLTMMILFLQLTLVHWIMRWKLNDQLEYQISFINHISNILPLSAYKKLSIIYVINYAIWNCVLRRNRIREENIPLQNRFYVIWCNLSRSLVVI